MCDRRRNERQEKGKRKGLKALHIDEHKRDRVWLVPNRMFSEILKRQIFHFFAFCPEPSILLRSCIRSACLEFKKFAFFGFLLGIAAKIRTQQLAPSSTLRKSARRCATLQGSKIEFCSRDKSSRTNFSKHATLTDRRADTARRQTARQPHKHTDTQTHRQTKIQTEIHTYTKPHTTSKTQAKPTT